MRSEPVPSRKKHLAVVAVIAACLVAIACIIAIIVSQKTASIFEPVDEAYSDGISYQPSSGSTHAVQYCSEIVAANDKDNPAGTTSTQIAFDDEWFLQDPGDYNNDLAVACMALSAIVNSESQHYGDADASTAYVEEALGELGFIDIRTDSYKTRSRIDDELQSLADDTADTDAYAIARKELPAVGEEPCTLVFVGVRGTFGAEWMSDLRVTDPVWSGVTDDHAGFKLAEFDVALDLADYLEENEIDVDRVKLLVTGHSRGGSVANLLAANLIDWSDGETPLVKANNLYAYTFAPSASTKSEAYHDESYRTIFNVANPTDLVPRFPLEAWGYHCYGTRVTIPGLSTEGFDEAYATMQRMRAKNTGFASTEPYHEGDRNVLDDLERSLVENVPDPEDLSSADGAIHAAQELVKLDLQRVIASHAPDTYLAWLQTVGEDGLSFA